MSFCPLVFLVVFFFKPRSVCRKVHTGGQLTTITISNTTWHVYTTFHHTHDQYHFPVSSFLSRTRYPLRLAHFDRRGSGLGGKFCDDTCYVPIFLTSFTRGMTYAVEYHNFPGRTRGRRLSFTSTGASSSSEQRLACRREIWIVKVGHQSLSTIPPACRSIFGAVVSALTGGNSSSSKLSGGRPRRRKPCAGPGASAPLRQPGRKRCRARSHRFFDWAGQALVLLRVLSLRWSTSSADFLALCVCHLVRFGGFVWGWEESVEEAILSKPIREQARGRRSW